MLINTQVGNIPATSLGDGTQPFALAGQSGEVVVTELHGKWYTTAKRGLVYIGSTALAGTIIPVNANNLVSTFTLWNPTGSGKTIELISYELGIAGTTTAVIGSVSLAFQAAVGSTITVPGTTTSLTPQNALLGSGTSSSARLLSAGTLTGTPTVLMSLGLSFGTTGANPGPVKASYDFDGKVLIPQGVLVTVVGNAAQTQAMQQQFVWAELPA